MCKAQPALPCKNYQQQTIDVAPTKVEAAPCEAIFISAMSEVLVQLCSTTDAQGPLERTHFDAAYAPPISLRLYIERLGAYFGCSQECFVLSLVFLDRLVKGSDNFAVSSANIHRVLVTALLIATKMQDDETCSNAYYAQVGGLAMNELNMLEAKMLEMMHYRCHVSAKEYEEYRTSILTSVVVGTAVASSAA